MRKFPFPFLYKKLPILYKLLSQNCFVANKSKNMADPIFIENHIHIDAPIEAVWEYLTHPDKTPQYMYGCKIISDFQVGSPIDWEAEVEGKKTVFVTGKIVAYEPPKLFSYTTFDPFSDIEDIPQNHLTVTYRLETAGEGTSLHISQGDYAIVAKGHERYADATAQGGWQGLMETIKAQIEG